MSDERYKILNNIISHELKTPLNAIIGFSELIIEEESVAEMRDYASIIKRSGAELLEKIHTVIDYSRYEYSDDKLQHIMSSEVIKRVVRRGATDMDKMGRGISIQILRRGGSDIVLEGGDIIEKILYHMLISLCSRTNNKKVFIGSYCGANETVLFVTDSSSHAGVYESTGALPINIEEIKQDMDIYGKDGLNMAICNGLAKKIGAHIWEESVKNGVNIVLYLKRGINE